MMKCCSPTGFCNSYSFHPACSEVVQFCCVLEEGRRRREGRGGEEREVGEEGEEEREREEGEKQCYCCRGT